MSTVYVHTLGDSTIDNLYWMLDPTTKHNLSQAKEASVEGQLKKKLNSEGASTYQVVSHAYDGFTTASVLNGDDIGRTLSITADPVVKDTRHGPNLNEQKSAYLKDRRIEQNSQSCFAHPLDQFKQFVNNHPTATHYVVISVGGNDFRERLRNPPEMLIEISFVHRRYLQILKEIKSLKDRDIRPILMLQYRLDANRDHYSIYTTLKIVGVIFSAMRASGFLGIAASAMALVANKVNRVFGLAVMSIGFAVLAISRLVIPLKVIRDVLSGQEVGMATLGGLLETFYKPILAQAKIDGIPILDLPNTFNPNDSSLYIAQIEPSQKGGELIAEGLSQIIKTHPFKSSKSIIYSQGSSQTGFTGAENRGPGTWSVGYPVVIRSV